jgi:hypothetical protein
LRVYLIALIAGEESFTGVPERTLETVLELAKNSGFEVS